MVVRTVLGGFAVLALGAAIIGPAATASPPCGRKACSDEVAASGLSGQAERACFKQVLAYCNAGACSCTGGSPPCSCVCGDGLCGNAENCATCPQDCGPCPTTTTTMGANCVQCGVVCDETTVCCPLPHATTFCQGACRIESCDSGWGDCNTFDCDGCETSVTTSSNCGFCFFQCAVGQQCVGGVCQ